MPNQDSGNLAALPALDPKLRIRLYFVKLFDRICRLARRSMFHRVLTEHAASSRDFFFVQIGANDGVIYDPIYEYVRRYGWKGLLVEPVGRYFDKLKENYRDNPDLSFENVAISDRDEVRDFYRIREGLDYLPRWCEGLGTFYLEVLLSHQWAIPNLERYVVKERVQCISLASLLEKHGVERLDLLSIDTEGYDYEIIRQIEFEKVKPRMILYEHQYITPDDRRRCEEMLRSHNYSLAKHISDTLAFQLPPPVRAGWN